MVITLHYSSRADLAFCSQRNKDGCFQFLFQTDGLVEQNQMHRNHEVIVLVIVRKEWVLHIHILSLWIHSDRYSEEFAWKGTGRGTWKESGGWRSSFPAVMSCLNAGIRSELTPCNRGHPPEGDPHICSGSGLLGWGLDRVRSLSLEQDIASKTCEHAKKKKGDAHLGLIFEFECVTFRPFQKGEKIETVALDSFGLHHIGGHKRGLFNRIRHNAWRSHRHQRTERAYAKYTQAEHICMCNLHTYLQEHTRLRSPSGHLFHHPD